MVPPMQEPLRVLLHGYLAILLEEYPANKDTEVGSLI